MVDAIGFSPGRGPVSFTVFVVSMFQDCDVRWKLYLLLSLTVCIYRSMAYVRSGCFVFSFFLMFARSNPLLIHKLSTHQNYAHVIHIPMFT